MSSFVRPIWDKKEFKELFTEPINAGQSKDATAYEIARMKRRSFLLTEQMKQFVHRKDQSILKVDLPAKHEYVIYVPLSEFQKKLYKDFLEELNVLTEKQNILQMVSWLSKIETHPDMIKKILQRKGVSQSSFGSTIPTSTPLNSGSGVENSIDIDSDSESDTLNLLEDLESIDLNIPLSWSGPVFEKSYKERDINLSSKMKVLFKIIEKCVEKDEKVLVFSQYTSTLDLMEDLISTRKFNDQKLRKGVDYCRLDGQHSLTSREKNIKDFNSNYSKKKVFFISTRAGGLGINLHAATRIVLFDVCWNPAEDQQAIFRAYRYGQSKPVFVYRLISAGDIEENIWKRCISKTWLFRRVVDEKTPARMLTKDDLNLYGFEQNQKIIEENSVDYNIIKDDKLIIGVASEMGVGINRIVEHESLFIDDKFDQITEEEKASAKIEYEDAKRFSQNHLLNGSLNSQLTRNKNEFVMGGKHQGMSLEELKELYGSVQSLPPPPQKDTVTHHLNNLKNSIVPNQPKIEYSKYGNFIQNRHQFQSQSQPQILPHIKEKFQQSMEQKFRTQTPNVYGNSLEEIDVNYLKNLQNEERKNKFSGGLTSMSKQMLKDSVPKASLNSLLASTKSRPTASLNSLLASTQDSGPTASLDSLMVSTKSGPTASLNSLLASTQGSQEKSQTSQQEIEVIEID